MDTAKIKNAFINHFEKMILAAVIGVSGFLIFQGLQLSHFTDEYDPSEQTQRARQVKNQIDENRTNAIVAEREPELDILARTNALEAPVDASPYKSSNVLERKMIRSVVRRKDPQLKPPRSIIMTGVVTTIAWQNRDRDATADDYPLNELDDVGSSGDGARSKENDDRDVNGDFGERGSDSGFGGGGLGNLGALSGSSGGGASTSGSNKSKRTRFDSKKDYGTTAKTVDGNPPIPRLARFIAGRAVVPHKELHEAYRLALRDADAYDVGRDAPLYVNLEVQRADVTKKSVDQLTDEDWSRVWSFNDYRIVAAKRWAGYAPDIVPPEFRDDRLSNWIPPVLLDDYREFVTHPLIPVVSPDELETDDEQEDDEGDLSDADLFANSARGFDRPRTGSSLGQMGGSGRSRSGLGNMGGSSSRGGIGGQAEEEDPVDYKLLRFYDFHDVGRKPPKAGTTYVYRVRFSVVDPNFPDSRDSAPRLSSLAPEVAERVLALREDAKQTGIRKYQRWSPWSEPSEPVTLPALSQQFAGPVNPGTIYTWPVDGKKVEYARSVPKGKIVTSQFNKDFGTRVPFLMNVVEGSVLSSEGDADVADPISMRFKSLPDAKVINGTTVIDLGGGAPLKLMEGMYEPGMMLLYDQNGKLIVSNEVDDMEFFDLYGNEDKED